MDTEEHSEPRTHRSLRGRIAERIRFWHVLVVVVVIALTELVTGLPGPWAVGVYLVAVVTIGAIMLAVYTREGGSILRRTDTTHGNDMHGHYGH